MKMKRKEQEILDGINISATDTDQCPFAVPPGEALPGPTPPKRCAAINSLLRIKRHPPYARPQACHLLVRYAAVLM